MKTEITFYKEKKFKETPIGKIPESWKAVKLKGYVNIETGKRARGGALDKGNVASIGGEHLDNEGDIQWDNMKFIPEDFYESLKQGKVQLRDILLVKDGATTGKVAIVRNPRYKKVAVNEHVFVLRSKMNKLVNEFLFYFLFSRFGQIQIRTRFHGMIGGITRSDIETILIPLPSLEEQKAIVHILSTIDEAIQKTNEIIKKIKRLKKGLMQELLTKGIGHKEFKNTEIGRIPKKWDIMRLKDIALIIMGQSPPSSTYNKDGVGLPFLQGKMEFGDIYPSPVMYCLKPIKIAEANDILISVRAPVGDVNLASYKLCIGRGLAAIRFNDKKADYLFYFYYLQKIKPFLETLGKGSTFKAIVKKDLESLKVPFPTLEEQRKISEILLTVDKGLKIERKGKEKLGRIKKALMDLLLTGKIRIKVN